MSEQHTTPYSNRVAILGELWINYRSLVELADFIEYNDLGLPLAYAIDSQIVESTPLAEQYINETWNLFLAALDIEEDTGFEDISEVFGDDI
jgi:hypothetical protein